MTAFSREMRMSFCIAQIAGSPFIPSSIRKEILPWVALLGIHATGSNQASIGDRWTTTRENPMSTQEMSSQAPSASVSFSASAARQRRQGGHQFGQNWLRRAAASPPPARVAAPAVPSQIVFNHLAYTSNPCILFLDSRVENLPAIIREAAGNLRIVLLDRDADGIRQIAHHLRERQSIELALIATADERGRLSLGCSSLTVGNLYAHEDDLRRIGAALSPTGRVRILGRRTQDDSSDNALLIMLSRLSGAAVESCPEQAWAIPWADIFHADIVRSERQLHREHSTDGALLVA
jgi:hypothetical protein